MKSIVFLLPCSASKPVGGFKVVYEYANRLVRDGINVHIVYSSVLFPKELSVVKRILSVLFYLKWKWQKRYLPTQWFTLDERVMQYFVYTLQQVNVPVADIYVATSWETAEYLMTYQGVDVRDKYYFIQHYEKWSCPDDERLLKTWKAPLHKIVIAPWLKDIANKLGESANVVENGFDFDTFEITLDIRKRQRERIVMLYHELEWKGFQDAFEALNIVKQKYPRLIVNLFGVYERPVNLPDWYVYYQMPDKVTLNKIYNEAAIYVGASHTEGWGLTVGEAMQCGCAVACTDNGGYSVVAHHQETALVSPVKDVKSLANNIIRLIENQELRCQLAENGNYYIKQYTWEKSYERLKQILLKDESVY